MSDFVGSLEDGNAERNVGSRHCPVEVSDVNENSIGNWTWGHSCYVFTKNLSTFCQFPKTFGKLSSKVTYSLIQQKKFQVA
jgi:hypothetical protein